VGSRGCASVDMVLIRDCPRNEAALVALGFLARGGFFIS
jgi:hypothetical protein